MVCSKKLIGQSQRINWTRLSSNPASEWRRASGDWSDGRWFGLFDTLLICWDIQRATTTAGVHTGRSFNKELLRSGVRDQNGQTGWRSWQGYRDSSKHRLQPRPAECHLCTHNTTNIQPVCTHRLEPTGHFIGYSTSKVYLLQWPVSIYNSLNEIF